MKKIKLSLTLVSLWSASIAPSLQASIYADYPNTFVKDTEQVSLEGLPDLDTMTQDFILETKQIVVPDCPSAFNPSIVRWKGALLMSFRTYDPKTGATNPLGIVFLNEDFEPISPAQIFELPFYNPVLPSKQQDPRLVVISDRLYMVYNNILEDVTDREMRRVFLTELTYDGSQFTASEPECLKDFEAASSMRYEKNWAPFEYEGELHLTYSITPQHKIFRPLLGTNFCETVCSSENPPINWNWGPIRGGTPALLDGDQYIAFFHSWVDRATVQSNGKKITHYVMGAYTFDAKPPFALRAVSPQPIVDQTFYRPPYYKNWKPLRCVFPAGILIDENFIWISYGRQDHEIWIAKMDKQALLQSLIPLPRS